MFEIIKAVIFGIVEGITEWLPISSTGHIILLDEFMKFSQREEFMEMFEVVIQLGAIFAVLVLFFKKLNPFAPSKSVVEKKNTYFLWLKIIVASIPAGIVGLLFDDKLDEIFYNAQTVSITLILYGIFFIIAERRNRKKSPLVTSLDSISYKYAFLIGVAQMLALIPGTSRSGATIVFALILGFSREISAEFSFFLSIPAMFGASALKLLKFFGDGGGFEGDELKLLIIGMVVSFAVSAIAIKFLLGYLKKRDFSVFGWYRIFLGILVILYFLVF